MIQHRRSTVDRLLSPVFFYKKMHYFLSSNGKLVRIKSKQTFLFKVIINVNGSSAICVDDRRKRNLYGTIDPPRWNTGTFKMIRKFKHKIKNKLV